MPRISKDQRPCLVLARPRLCLLPRSLRSLNPPMLFSIIIPTLGRSASLEECVRSIERQSCRDYEIIKVTEEGSLASLRNEGAKRATGKYLVFIDDDVVAERGWLDAIRSKMAGGCAGVSGPSVIMPEFRTNRDCFKFPLHWFSDPLPGRISPWGMWSLSATDPACSFYGEVEYLEACNMAFDRQIFWSMNGFDERYKGIGDWSEPDLCFRIRESGHRLWFSRDARVEHRPSKSGAYKKRLVKCDRMENYELFSKRWIKQSIRHRMFKQFLRTYFLMKEHGWI